MKIKTKFKEEFRKQLRLAIAAAVGFIIAYSWRDFIVGLVNKLVVSITSAINTNLIDFYTAILITLIGVIIIIITSKLLQKN